MTLPKDSSKFRPFCSCKWRRDPSREIEGPMAIVILGGLVTSTALNLLVLPTISLRYGRFEGIESERA
jgi:Cu/Ag efflux pump CusA